VKVPAGWDVGAATHTGQVRVANEDDYAVVLADPDVRLFAIADGMGGMSGGAEASRAAVRALCGVFLAPSEATVALEPAQDRAERMRRGFDEAAARVHERSRELPALRDMGTTLTAVAWGRDGLTVGHVGDTRLLRSRRGRVEVLTKDHVLHQGQSILTNCVGAGQREVHPDVFDTDCVPGDVYVLLTDGVWNTVGEAGVVKGLRAGSAQNVAADLVRRALAAGAPDNATAVVFAPGLGGGGAGGGGSGGEIALPTDESAMGLPAVPMTSRSLRFPWWPWVVLVLAIAVAALAWWRLQTGWSPF